MKMEIDIAGVIEFVAKRRKESGGYGATPRLPATIEDSYEAMAIACSLNRQAPGTTLMQPPEKDEPLHDYLTRALARPWPGLRTTAQLVRAGRKLGLPLDRKKGLDYLKSHLAASPDFHTVCHTAFIAADLNLEGFRPKSWREVLLPNRLTVRETLHFLRLRKITGHEPLAPEFPDLAAWLRRCQNGDGGFGFFPGTTSFIENCHFALASLALLGSRPANPATARRFILSCQTGSGGFGRNPKAAPFLDATWHGLAGLESLLS